MHVTIANKLELKIKLKVTTDHNINDVNVEYSVDIQLDVYSF